MSLMLRLQSIDPEYAKIVHINNKKRLIRALEIFELTGFQPTKHTPFIKEHSILPKPLLIKSLLNLK